MDDFGIHKVYLLFCSYIFIISWMRTPFPVKIDIIFHDNDK